MTVGDTGNIEKTIEPSAAVQEGSRIIIQFYLVVTRVMKATTSNFIRQCALSLSEYT